MATTVTSISPSREVHDIDVTTKKGRRCSIYIYRNNGGFDSEVIILDGVSSNPGGWVYKTTPASPSATDNFRAALDLIKKYLSQVDPQDTIKRVHNPCNTPFISEKKQNAALSQEGISLSVQIN